MSRASKLTLLGTSLFAASTIIFVHFQQKSEQQVCDLVATAKGKNQRPAIALTDHPPLQAMHEGVVRDMEQQRIKRERQLDFDMQKALEEEYKREQKVHSSLETPIQSVGKGMNKS